MRTLINRTTQGDAILERFGDIKAPGSLKNDLAAFKAQHTSFTKLATAVVSAEDAYDVATGKVATLDGARDVTVLAIADKLPGAGLSKRGTPFAGLSDHAPSALVNLAYAAEGVAVTALLKALRKKQLPADIAKLCATLETQSAAVDVALKTLSKPLAVVNEARAKRDATIPDWDKQLRRLSDASKVAFRDDPGRFAAVFAPPDPVQTHVKPTRRKPKPTTPPTDPNAPATTSKPAKAKRRKKR